MHYLRLTARRFVFEGYRDTEGNLKLGSFYHFVVTNGENNSRTTHCNCSDQDIDFKCIHRQLLERYWNLWKLEMCMSEEDNPPAIEIITGAYGFGFTSWISVLSMNSESTLDGKRCIVRCAGIKKMVV